jgi:hypothetical protein
MTRSGQRILSFFLVVLAGTTPAFAQQQPPPDDRVQRLEQKLDELLRQAAEIRDELQQLRTGNTAPPAEAPEEDLTKVDVPETPATTPALTDVQPVENATTPSAGKVFNPDISVIGTFLGHAGDGNPFESPGVGLVGFGQIGQPLTFAPYLTAGEERAPFALDEAEVAFEAFIDPYAKGRFFISIGPEGAELEEGYAQFVTLPWGLTAKAGKTKAAFGKANTWHTHTRPWVDQPMMITRFFGEEGFNDTGVSVSKIINAPGNLFIEATAEAFGGDVDGVFARDASNDLAYNTHLKVFRDLTENSNLEAGATWARGNLAVPEVQQFPDFGIGFPVEPFSFQHGRNQFTGVDLTYRWKPLSRSIYRSFIARFEGFSPRTCSSRSAGSRACGSTVPTATCRCSTTTRPRSVSSIRGAARIPASPPPSPSGRPSSARSADSSGARAMRTVPPSTNCSCSCSSPSARTARTPSRKDTQ